MDPRTMRGRILRSALGVALWMVVLSKAMALSPDSPVVKAAVRKAVEYLEAPTTDERRLGGRAVVALALLKSGSPVTHPLIRNAATDIHKHIAERKVTNLNLDVYTTGLSLIFLISLDPKTHREDIRALLTYLQTLQKLHGGWGYPERRTGDTSMTQYGVLGAWEAAQAGFNVPTSSVAKVTRWLLLTQDPSGAFGYQGTVSHDMNVRVKQTDVRPSLAVAGLGSLCICADLLGYIEKHERDEDLPLVVREVYVKKKADPESIRGDIDPKWLMTAMRTGRGWMEKNQEIPKQSTYYYLYGLERYRSFRELIEGGFDPEPRWYTEGARFLLQGQTDDGSWQGAESIIGRPVDTAFAVLFLVRSSKKSIDRTKLLGNGTMTSGWELPYDTSDVELCEGKVRLRSYRGSVKDLLAALADPCREGHPQAIRMLEELPPGEAAALVSGHPAALDRLVRTGTAPVRAGILRLVARTDNFDHVPLLVRAIEDPDPSVWQAACKSLERLSRTWNSSELPADTSLADRGPVIQKWKSWYLGVRPDAQFDDGT